VQASRPSIAGHCPYACRSTNALRGTTPSSDCTRASNGQPKGSERDCAGDRSTPARRWSRTRATAVAKAEQDERLVRTLEGHARADVDRPPNMRPVEVQATGA